MTPAMEAIHRRMDTVQAILRPALKAITDATEELVRIRTLITEAEAERVEANDPLIERLAFEAAQWAKDPANNPGADQPSLVFARRFAFLLRQQGGNERVG